MGIGAYLSGEAGHYWLGTTDSLFAFADLPDYTYWNVGIGFTYKVLTIDFRYHDTDLSEQQCFALTGDPAAAVNGGFSNWCGSAFIVKGSIDTTFSALK
jgi:hypothetical protein